MAEEQLQGTEGTEQNDTLDFGKLTLDDVKLDGQQLSKTEDNTDPEAKKDDEKKDEDEKNDAKQDDEVKDDKKDDAKKDPEQVSSGEDNAQKDITPAEYKWKDDFIKQAVEYYEKTGDLTPYLQAKTIDFDAMTDEEIMRRDLRESYPDVSEKAFEKLFKQQVIEKFKLDPDQWDEDDTELGKELLRSEASKLRSKYLDWQKGFRAPEPQPDNSAKEAEAQALKELQEFEQEVKTNALTKSLLESKRIAIKTGDGEFNYEVNNPNKLLDMTLDNNQFFAQFANPDGQIDYNKWYLTSAFSQDPEGFIKAIGNYFKGLGREEIAKEIKNPSDNKVNDIPTEGSGDFTTGLLNAFASRGVKK